ncbi:MAG: iron-containing alcohol dehydrogenase [Bryobacteraceae bacterium]
MRFDFAAPHRILFGEGAAREAAPAARGMGRRVLLVTGRSPERAAAVAGGLDSVPLAVTGEPTLEIVREGARLARENGCDVVLAVGGGSAIDAGKAVAALMTNGGDPLDYLEVIGKGQPIEKPSAPFIAVPTTAGTGSEATRNSVLASTEGRVKASLRSPFMLPRLAIVDPELTFGLPPALTASTGLDALTQLIEPYCSVRANPMTDMFCVEGMTRAREALPRACADGADREARASMAFASLLGGLSLANAGLGAVHGFAAPVGGSFPAPHGAVCAALLPHVMEINITALRARAPAGLARYATVAGILTGRPGAQPEDGAKWVRELCARLQVPPLSAYGVSPQHVPALVEQASKASSMKANPIALTREELTMILERAIR